MGGIPQDSSKDLQQPGFSTSNPATFQSPVWTALGKKDQERLVAGETVVIEEDLPGKAWPRFTLYHLVKGTPEQVAAVFWDCELDPAYIPNCTTVRIIKRPGASVIEGQYTLKMPFFLREEVYVSRNELTQPAPGVYEIKWKVLKSRYSKDCSGSLRAEPFDKERTLLRYRNLVEPASSFAKLLRSKAGNQVYDSVSALVLQTEREVEKSPELILRQIANLRQSLHVSPEPSVNSVTLPSSQQSAAAAP